MPTSVAFKESGPQLLASGRLYKRYIVRPLRVPSKVLIEFGLGVSGSRIAAGAELFSTDRHGGLNVARRAVSVVCCCGCGCHRFICVVVGVVGVSDSTLDVDMHIPRLATTHASVSQHHVPPAWTSCSTGPQMPILRGLCSPLSSLLLLSLYCLIGRVYNLPPILFRPTQLKSLRQHDSPTKHNSPLCATCRSSGSNVATNGDEDGVDEKLHTNVYLHIRFTEWRLSKINA